MVLESLVVSCTARYPKSMSFSGWPMAQLASGIMPWPRWPSSVAATAYPCIRGAASTIGWIDPAHPPLPRCMYLPFQLSTGGSHRAKPISESAVGRAGAGHFAVTRHGHVGHLRWHSGGLFQGAGSGRYGGLDGGVIELEILQCYTGLLGCRGAGAAAGERH